MNFPTKIFLNVHHRRSAMKNESGYKTKFEQAEYKIVKNLNLNIS